MRESACVRLSLLDVKPPELLRAQRHARVSVAYASVAYLRQDLILDELEVLLCENRLQGKECREIESSQSEPRAYG
jgi:hypothetical protein